METLRDLEEYLVYMQQIGYSGLAVDHNPFTPAPPKAVQVSRTAVQPAPARHAPAQPAPPRSAPVPNKPVPMREPRTSKPAPSRAIPNLHSIMDMVSAPAEDTAAKVKAVTGQTPVDVLRGLYRAFEACQACALGTTRNSFVFGEGPPDAALMFVGESPGVEDDQSGRTFSQTGEAGKLLTRIIEGMGFQREQVFVTTTVKCHPPEQRTPLPDELASCAPVLVRQIETVNPRVIVALGPGPLRFFLGPDTSFARSRGRFFQWRGIQVMPTYDPAYIIRNPVSKRDTWEDLKQVLSLLRHER